MPRASNLPSDIEAEDGTLPTACPPHALDNLMPDESRATLPDLKDLIAAARKLPATNKKTAKKIFAVSD